MTDNLPKSILKILHKELAFPNTIKTTEDPFETLIATIISQNTADTNTKQAFENLASHFKITPQVLSTAEKPKIEECIRAAGLSKSKTKTIQNASYKILEKFGGSMKPILSMELEQARKTLMEIPGVGPKTADVVLLFSAHKYTIPVDTHVNRVSKRLGLSPPNSSKEEVRSNLQSKFSTQEYLSVHLLLISLGRKYCKAHNPLCQDCPVCNICPKIISGNN